jgi:hypothetical protein
MASAAINTQPAAGTSGLDYHYFGPPYPGAAASPYWPEGGGVPWNIVDARSALPRLLVGLGAAVENGPYRALPRELRCACAPPRCLLPTLDKYCEVNQIPRTSTRPPLSIPTADLKFILLVPRIVDVSAGNGADGPRLIVAAGSQAVYASLHAHKVHPDPDAALRTAWRVADLDTLAAAVCTDESDLWAALVAAVRKTA